MPGLDGFEVIEALEDPPCIIFVTAYDEYAIRAFEVNALDYLLKPFSRARLEEAIHRAQTALAEEQEFAARLRPVLESLAAQGQYLTRLAVRDLEHIRVLDANEIDWIGLEDEQVMVHVGDEAYPVRRTLAELASRLDPATFFRAHRSAIVNLNRVRGHPLVQREPQAAAEHRSRGGSQPSTGTCTAQNPWMVTKDPIASLF